MAGKCDDFLEDSAEDLTFIDEIVNIARTQEAELRSAGSVDDFSSSRYKNNWDDLDELCAELTSRDPLSKVDFCVEETDFAIDREFNFLSESEQNYETTREEPVYEELDNCAQESDIYNRNNNNSSNAERFTVVPVTNDNRYTREDSETIVHTSERTAQVTANRDNNVCGAELNKVLVPPPRRKKLAKLNKAKLSSTSPNKCAVTRNDDVVSAEIENCAIQSDSGISDGTCNGLHVKTSSLSSNADSTDLARESSETGSRHSESFGSEFEQVPSSSFEGAPSNQRRERKNKITGKVNGKYSVGSRDDSVEPLNGVNRRHKNIHDEKATSLTGFLLERETTAAYQGKSAGCESVSLQADAHCQYKQIRESEIAENSLDDNLAAHGSDSGGSHPGQDQSANAPVCRRSTAEDSSGGEDKVSPLTLQGIKDPESYTPDQVTVSADYEITEQESVSYSGDDVADYSADSRKSNSIYIDSDDLQNVDGKLVVRPAVGPLSACSDDPGSDVDATQGLRDCEQHRRHSTLALDHIGTDISEKRTGVSGGPREISKGRSKSVVDLSCDTSTYSHRGDSRRNSIVSNRVIRAVGKFSLRVRDVFKPRNREPSQFYVEEDSEDYNMPRSSKRQQSDKKCDKKYSAKLDTEAGGDYSGDSRPVSADQPSDVKTVQSCPEFEKSAKPKGKLSAFFGMGGKKWYTIGALPKLLKRKPKDKYSKSDKMSSASSQEFESVASAPASGGKTKIVHVNGRHAANAKDKSAKEKTRRHDADSRYDLPTFISLEEYRRRMEDIEKEELERLEKRKRSRSMPYLDTSEEEEQGYTARPEHYRADRRRRPESYDEIRHRNDPRDTRRTSEPVELNDKRRRYKRREKNDRNSYQDSYFDDIDKSTMAVDYGFDVYHFRGHPSMYRPQSMSDLTYSDGPSNRYNNQPRNRNSLAAIEDRGRRRPLQPRDRNSIAVPNSHVHHVPERTKKERIPRPKSVGALPTEESLSSEEDPSATRRRKGNKKQKEPVRRRDSSPEIDPLEDAIQKHLKHENGPIARRKIERKGKQETGSMRRLKESFMAKKIWENVYDQLLKDLSPKSSKPQSNAAAKKAIEST